MPERPTILWLSDRVLRITHDASQDHSIAHAWHIADAIRAATIDAIDDITLAYAGVQVRVSEHIAMDARAAARVEALIQSAIDRAVQPAPTTTNPQPVACRSIDIPVCYDADFALDLESLARETALRVDDLIALHAGATYHVHFLGFLPGFAYMGGVPEPLRVARHPSPRTRVPAGSVAIAGAQAGIYPSTTPGGWRILGRTPLTVFDPSRNLPSLLQPGDQVRFVRIDRARFDHLAHNHAPKSREPRP